jgi:hypothetical protein
MDSSNAGWEKSLAALSKKSSLRSIARCQKSVDMPKTPLLSLAVCVLTLAHVCVGDLSIRWAYNIQNAQILERLAVSFDQSFVVASVNFSNSNSLYAFSADPGTTSGSLLWKIDLVTGQPNALLGRPSISPDGNYVAVGCFLNCPSKNAFVVAINGNSPSIVWSDLLKSPQDISTLAIEGIPAWRPDSSFVYFQDVQYGNIIEVQLSGASPSITGRAAVPGPGASGAPSPIMSPDGNFLFACSASSSTSGVLNSYPLPMQDLNKKAKYYLPLNNPCAATGHLSKANNMLYIGDNNGTYAIDITNGKLLKKWYYSTGFNVYSSPAVVYYTSASSPSQQVAIATTTPVSQMISRDFSFSGLELFWLIFLRQVVSVYSDNQGKGAVVAVDAVTGTYLWSQPTDGAIQGSPVAIANFVFVGSLSGDVVSYDINIQGAQGSSLPPWIKAAQSTDKFAVGELCCSSLLRWPFPRHRILIYAVSTDGKVGTSINRIDKYTDRPAVRPLRSFVLAAPASSCLRRSSLEQILALFGFSTRPSALLPTRMARLSWPTVPPYGHGCLSASAASSAES